MSTEKKETELISEQEVINTYQTLREEVSQLFRQLNKLCLLYTSPSPRDVEESRMPSSA